MMVHVWGQKKAVGEVQVALGHRAEVVRAETIQEEVPEHKEDRPLQDVPELHGA